MTSSHIKKPPLKGRYKLNGHFYTDGTISPQTSHKTIAPDLTITHLPSEIILLIGEKLKSKELYRLILTNRLFANILIDHLHKLACMDKKLSTTALFYAAALGNEAFVRLLLEKGTEIKVMEYIDEWQRPGYETIHETPDECYEELFIFVLEQAENLVLGYDEEEYTALLWAIVSEDKALTNILFEKGADVVFKTNSRNGSGPLHAAVIRFGFTMIYFLLDNGFPVDTVDFDGLTALQFATQYQFNDVRGKAVIMLLIERGASVTLENQFNKKTLHWATSFEGWGEVVNLILDMGADVNSRDIYGSTALHSATLLGHSDIIDVLLKRGANVNLMDWNGDTPLGLAALYGRDTIAYVSSRHYMGPKTMTESESSSKNNH